MRKKVGAVAIAIVAMAAAAIGLWLVFRTPQTMTGVREALGVKQEGSASATVASGFLEADLIQVRAEQGARVVSIRADEGDMVVQGEALAQLDDTILRSRIEVAEADVAVAQAVLAEVAAGTRPESLRRAEAEVVKARAARDAAQRAWQDALTMLENPQAYELALTEVRGELAALGYQERQAEALASSGQAVLALATDALQILEGIEPHEEWVLIGEYDLGQVPPGIPLPPNPIDGEYYLGEYRIVIHGGTVSVYVGVTVKVPANLLKEAQNKQAEATYDAWAAWTAVDQAEAARQGAESVLAELARHRETPLSLQAQVHAAEANYGIAAAAVELAESQVEGLEMGATPEQIGVVRAQVEAASAALNSLVVQMEQYVVRAPISGLVLERAAGVGDVVAPGAALLTLADLDRLSVTAYVPEGQLGSIVVDQEVAVTVDAFPGGVFAGVVTSIASQAEFSPKDVQTHEERANLVFAIRVAVDNSDGALKPGMPANVHLAPEPSTGAEPSSPGSQPPVEPGFAGADEGSPKEPLVWATGSVEGRETTIVSELGGRVDRVLAREGDEIEAGQPVIELDKRSRVAQLAEARAAEAGARANLAQVMAGAHPAEILSAEASLGQADAECEAAASLLRDAQAMLQDPQELNAQIVEARAVVAVQETQVELARSEVAAAEAERDRYRSQGSLEEKGMYTAWDYQVQAAHAAVEAAQTRLQASQDKLDGLEAMRDNPLAALSEVHAAEGRREIACADMAVAQAKLDELNAGPSKESVRVAEAQVDRAGAALRLVESQIELLLLKSPTAGEVTSRLAEPGEIAVAGAALLRITDLDEVSLVVYVTMDQLGSIQVGQAVEARVDAYPGATFPGTVSRISEEAEFAPGNVQTDEDRAGMVVAVTIRLPNPGHKLRIGMPADVSFLRE